MLNIRGTVRKIKKVKKEKRMRARKRSKHLIYIMQCINKLLKPPPLDGCE